MHACLLNGCCLPPAAAADGCYYWVLAAWAGGWCMRRRLPTPLPTRRRPPRRAEKLQRVRELCQRLGVHTQAVCVGGVWVVPLLSWYHGCWDREPDVPGATPITKV